MTTTTTVTTTTETTVQPETSRVRATLHDVVVGDVEIHGDGDEAAPVLLDLPAGWHDPCLTVDDGDVRVARVEDDGHVASQP